MRRSFRFELMAAVVALIIGLAGGLALVVLFHARQHERVRTLREMATLKVLGFTDREVHTYVNKEMMILTGVGIVAGLPLGRFIGGLLTAALNMPSIYFEVEVHWWSYLIAAVITLVFALLVQLITNPVLDRIDPVSSLSRWSSGGPALADAPAAAVDYSAAGTCTPRRSPPRCT